MRKRMLAIVLLAAAGLACPSPAPAQALRSAEPTIVVDMQSAKKKRFQRRLVTAGVAGVITIMVLIFVTLNALDRRAARRVLMEKLRERQERGLV